MNDFYVTLPSNTDPENETSNFSVRLPTKLDLQGKWEVALSEIQYPHSWNNVKQNTLSSGFGLIDNCLEITFTNKIVMPIYVPPGYYGTIKELIQAIQYGQEKARTIILHTVEQQDKTGTFKLRKKLKPSHGKDVVESFQLEYNETIKRVQCKMLQSRIRMVRLSDQLQYMLGFVDPIISMSKDTALYQPDIRGGFYSLYVYCSLVEPQIVGNVTAPLLRNVHIEGSHGEMVEKLYHSPHYVPVIAKEVDRIEIDIKDDKNQSVPFQFGKTVVKLHFRKKRTLL